ncbi:MAG: FtsX-like permease family protein [Candidatus Binatus sp.]|uniref:ABC transporter permease n=1 Tax=Candidatus Binatus sp. TaxID=2811406 RepID=UPI00271EC80D|nr:ABC transporter permease [Candidatus Binatus sp.]MDO8432548.1 FtsX-like permease family protein [Candidatus Binatus sp.]
MAGEALTVIPIRYNLRSLMVRRTTSAMTALVVMILFILSGFVAGLRQTVLKSAVPDTWIVLSRGTATEPDSYLTLDQYKIIKSRAQIATNAKGQPLVSPEMVTGFNPAPEEPASKVIFTHLRGVYPIAYEVHRGMKLESGRWPTGGTAEMVVGRKLAARFPNLAVGSNFRFGKRDWKIVGTFSDRDSARESEVLTDLDLLTQDFHMGHGFNLLHVILKPGTEEAFKSSLTTDARVRVDVVSEHEFYTRQTDFVDQLRALGLAVAIILAIRSIFGAMNTMYAAVTRRTGEIGVLRALGFNRFNVLISFVSESILLGIAGAIVGEILGIVVATATGLSSDLMNVGSFIFRFQMTPGAFVAGLVAGALIGALGGLLPAWRASRVGVIDSLRAV